MTDWRSSLRSDPIPWLLETANAPIRYRVLTELLDRPREDPQVAAARVECLAYAPALQVQRKQRKDGAWGGRIHSGEARKEPSLESALTKLFEFGWQRDAKPIRDATKTLRSFLGSRRDLKLFEFQKAVKGDERREKYYRWFLRIVSLAQLVRGGYLDDKTRAGILDLLGRVAAFVDNPVSRNPTEEIGTHLPMIRIEAWRDGYPFLPDRYVATAFAYSPWLLDGEVAKMRLKKVFDYVLSSTYQTIAPDLGLVRTAKGSFAKGFGIALHPVEQYTKRGAVDEMLVNLELFARLGLINRYPLLMSQLEWLQSQQSKEGRWNLSTKLISDASHWTQLLRIEKDWRSPARKESDMTFRMLLILKYQWERQIRMLDRRDDAYPI